MISTLTPARNSPTLGLGGFVFHGPLFIFSWDFSSLTTLAQKPHSGPNTAQKATQILRKKIQSMNYHNGISPTEHKLENYKRNKSQKRSHFYSFEEKKPQGILKNLLNTTVDSFFLLRFEIDFISFRFENSHV